MSSAIAYRRSVVFSELEMLRPGSQSIKIVSLETTFTNSSPYPEAADSMIGAGSTQFLPVSAGDSRS